MKGKNQMLVGFTGSIENMTVTKAKDGDSVIKGKITTMTNPKTERQVGNRTAFSTVVKQASRLLMFLNLFFKPTKITHSSSNSYVKQAMEALRSFAPYNQNGVLSIPTDNLFVNAPGMQITNGGTYPLDWDVVSPDAVIAENGDKEYDISWGYDEQSVIQDGTDEVHVVYINPQTGDWNTTYLGKQRSNLAAKIIIPASVDGALTLSVFAVSTSTGEASRSTLNATAIEQVITKAAMS